MRGFLRRSLESARGAEQRLKPLTGSVYAGDHRRQQFERKDWGEETVYTPPSHAAALDARQLSTPGTSPAALPATPEILLPVRSDPREAAVGGHRNSSESQPSLPAAYSPASSSAAPSGLQSATRTSSQRGAFEAPASLPLPMRPASLHSGLKQDERSHAEAAVPQAPQQVSRADKQAEESRRAASILKPQVDPLLRAGITAKPPSAPPQLSLPRNRAPEEPQVQVHIGRIEVIAAAPQPPRVPTPRPNRATSLADYLAGRNGRLS